MMRVEPARVGARVIDSYEYSLGGTADDAQWIADNKEADCLMLYLGVANADRMNFALRAGLAVMTCTTADRFDGLAAVRQNQMLGIPAQASTWLDIEGLSICPPKMDPMELIAKASGWGNIVAANNYMPCGYFGSPQPLTSNELYSLKVFRYWQGQGRTSDRHGQLAEPGCGWCMHQYFPSQRLSSILNADGKPAGLLVDYNCIGEDYRGRVPNWVVDR